MAPWVPFWKLVSYWLYLALYFVVCEATWDYPAETPKTVLFKALPILHLIFVVFSSDNRAAGYADYKWNVVCGLGFSMLGDACLVWRVQLFLPGLMFFAVAHVFYVRAFGMTHFGGGPTATSCLILAGLAFLTIAPNIREGPFMYTMVFLYSCLIFTIVWRSVVSAQTWPCLGNYFACIGALSFAISDFLIAYDKWCAPVEGAAMFVMATYFAAQMFIALSVVCFEERLGHFKLE